MHSLPAAGTLQLSGVTVTADQSITVAQIPNLVYTPAANANGPGYRSEERRVGKECGTAKLGQHSEQTPNTLNFDVTLVNYASAGTSSTLTILEDGSHTFTAADFGFTDPVDAATGARRHAAFHSDCSPDVPSSGLLQLSGVTVTADQSITVAQIPNLVYTPAANANGPGY